MVWPDRPAGAVRSLLREHVRVGDSLDLSSSARKLRPENRRTACCSTQYRNRGHARSRDVVRAGFSRLGPSGLMGTRRESEDEAGLQVFVGLEASVNARVGRRARSIWQGNNLMIGFRRARRLEVAVCSRITTG
jgi:hypothetical protein